jgi:hypothetical protein
MLERKDLGLSLDQIRRRTRKRIRVAYLLLMSLLTYICYTEEELRSLKGKT